jgi:hypothetical protein
MARAVPYLFCRYVFTMRKKALSAEEQLSLLQELKGVAVVYRKRDPGPDDADTFAMKPVKFVTSGRTALTWCVGYYVKQRVEVEYDQKADDIVETMVDTDGIKFTRFIAVPSLGVMAVRDQVGDTHLGGIAGISRLKAVVRSRKGVKIVIDPAATAQDVEAAIANWSLEQFSFSVRPFNPTPKRLGAQLDKLMNENKIKQLRGVALPEKGEYMRGADDGFLEEAVGLSNEGYGQVSVKGITPDGLKAVIAKPHFSQDKEENKKRQARPRSLKVYVDAAVNEDKEARAVVKALLAFYGQQQADG